MSLINCAPAPVTLKSPSPLGLIIQFLFLKLTKILVVGEKKTKHYADLKFLP